MNSGSTPRRHLQPVHGSIHLILNHPLEVLPHLQAVPRAHHRLTLRTTHPLLIHQTTPPPTPRPTPATRPETAKSPTITQAATTAHPTPPTTPAGAIPRSNTLKTRAATGNKAITASKAVTVSKVAIRSKAAILSKVAISPLNRAQGRKAPVGSWECYLVF